MGYVRGKSVGQDLRYYASCMWFEMCGMWYGKCVIWGYMGFGGNEFEAYRKKHEAIIVNN